MDRLIQLVSKSYTQDEIGQEVETENKVKVYADVFSASQSEFYKAGQSGFKPILVCAVWSFEYNNETEIEIDGQCYSIYRTFKRTDEKTELYCEKRTGNGN